MTTPSLTISYRRVMILAVAPFCLDALDICAGHARAGQGRLHRGGTSRLQKNEGLLRGFRPQDRYGEWMFAERLLYLQPRNMHAGT